MAVYKAEYLPLPDLQVDEGYELNFSGVEEGATATVQIIEGVVVTVEYNSSIKTFEQLMDAMFNALRVMTNDDMVWFLATDKKMELTAKLYNQLVGFEE